MGHTETTADVIEFARACGQHRPVQLVFNQFADGEPTAHRLDRPFVLIGRAADCDVRLRHPDVSYRHAYLQIVGGRALCVDLASRTGTRWKAGTQSYGWIDPGEDVGIGPFSLSYRGEESDLPAEAEFLAQSDGSTLPAAALEFLNGRDASERPRVWPLRRSVTLVGASPACNIQLRHESVSKVHSSLVLTPEGLWVIDLLGRHGTRVNATAVRCARLQDGDELRIGRFHMAVRLGEHAQASEWCGSPGGTITARSVTPQSEPQAASALTRRRASQASPSRRRLSVPKPAAGGDTRPPERTYSEAFILRLMDQFAAMQQQAMIQSQQQIMMLVQLFSSMHQSQQELIREELARVHEINRRLQELHTEMVRRQATQHLTPQVAQEPEAQGEAPPADSAAAPSEMTGMSEAADDAATAASFEFPVSALEDLVASLNADEDLEEPAAETAPRGVCDAAEADECVAAETADTDEDDEDESDVIPVSDDSAEEDHPPAGVDEGSPALQHPDADAHAWLAEQIDRLQREREGRWRKVLRMVGAGRL